MVFNFSEDIILENDRVFLRPLLKKDEPALLPVAMADASLLQFSPHPIYNETLLAAYIATALAEREARFRYPFIIFDKLANAFAGSTSFAYISDKDKRLEIGWTWMGNEFQKTGLNRNSKYLMLHYAFETLHFERVEFKTDERNIKSRTAIEKLGAQQEGILRSHTVMYDGFRRNTVFYSILKTEWPAVKNRLLTKMIAR